MQIMVSDELFLIHLILKLVNQLAEYCDFFHYRYTLGGFFLANYEDSPAGVFDEVQQY